MSFMDRKNILDEGFFDMFKKLPKNIKKHNLTSAEKKLYKKDPEFRKTVDKFYAATDEVDAFLDSLDKK